MKALSLVSGTPEWHEHRAKARNASEASALMGASPYDNYHDLVMRRALGVEQEHSDYTKEVVFQRGHDIEEAIRPVIENDFDTEFFPTVATSDDGFLSASFDGITVCQTVIWECKQWSEKKLADVREGRVPEQDYWQVVQQMAVSGAEKCIYTVSNGEIYEYVELLKSHVEHDFDVLKNSWAQFDEDVKNYQHVEEKPVQVVEGVAPDTLPALRVEVSGMVTSSNLEQFKQTALAVFGGIKTDLSTDEDFANAKKTVKWCKDVEGKLADVKEDALAQTSSIDELFKAIDEIKEAARQTRLTLDKNVKDREKAVRAEIKEEYNNEFDAHLDSANERCYPYSIPKNLYPDFGAAMKGKRSISSIRESCNVACMEAKIEVTRVADLICANAKVIADHQIESANLFADDQSLVLKDTDDLKTLCKARIVEFEAKEKERLEAERERIREEEAEKAKAEAVRQRLAEEARERQAQREIESLKEVVDLIEDVQQAPVQSAEMTEADYQRLDEYQDSHPATGEPLCATEFAIESRSISGLSPNTTNVCHKSYASAELEELIGGDSNHLEVVSNKIIEHGRWHVLHELVFKEGIHFFQTSYRNPATESQEVDRFNSDYVRCIEVFPHKVMTIVYKDHPHKLVTA